MKRLLAALASMTLGLAVVGAAVPAVASDVPFTDPASTGKITLCNTLGQPVTSGDIHIKPFVWTAVGSSAAPAGYGQNGKAAIYGFQPIKGVTPAYWFGQYVTQSARYTNPQRPMAGASAADPSLSDYLDNYPTKWNGLIQLRLFLSAPGQAAITTRYDTAVIQVSGNTWTLVDGGTDGCSSGTTKPDEWVVPSISAQGTPAANATTDAAGLSSSSGNGATHSSTSRANSSTSSTPGKSSNPGTTPTPSGSGASNTTSSGTHSGAGDSSSPVASVHSSHSNSAGWLWFVFVVIAAVVVAGYFLIRRRRVRGDGT
jgi:hypothetical protein